ncbi:hypothetical protein PCLA_09f0030 [Pseudomonas citronellolis]|nr:hypothetical protein PCLA_09f0030 [Pseudomonas citronellolis]
MPNTPRANSCQKCRRINRRCFQALGSNQGLSKMNARSQR